MKNLRLPAPKIGGEEATTEQLESLIDEREMLEFDVKDGDLVATFAMIVNPINVRAAHVEEYQKEMAELAVLADELDSSGEEIQSVLEAEGHGDEEKRMDTEHTRETLRIVSESLSLTRRLAEARAKLLHRAIDSWNVPGKSVSVELLTARTGVGPAALAKLGEWFFPTSKAPEEAPGTTPIPSSDNTSDTSPLMGDAVPIPLTS